MRDEIPDNVRESMTKNDPPAFLWLVFGMAAIGGLIYAGKCMGWLAP